MAYPRPPGLSAKALHAQAGEGGRRPGEGFFGLWVVNVTVFSGYSYSTTTIEQSRE